MTTTDLPPEGLEKPCPGAVSDRSVRELIADLGGLEDVLRAGPAAAEVEALLGRQTAIIRELRRRRSRNGRELRRQPPGS